MPTIDGKLASEVFSGRPERAIIVNRDIDPAEASASGLPYAMEFMFNPDQLNYVARAEWARIAVPGLSHEVLQYSHSQSDEIKFDLEWSAQEAQRRLSRFDFTRGADRPREVKLIELSEQLLFKYHDFLRALTVPVERGRAPSRVSLIWPGFLHVVGVVTSVDFAFTRFAQSGPIMGFTAGIEMVELRTVFRQRRGASGYFDARNVSQTALTTRFESLE